MDEQEIRRRQEEGFKLRRELGDKEYRKIKAARRRQYYEETQRMLATRSAIANTPPEVLAEKLERPKKRGCFVQIMVVDEGGEYTAIWEAPALMGTVMPGKRGRGYIDMAKPLLQQIYGKLVDKQT